MLYYIGNRGVAQVVAHLTGGQGVAGSSPVTPTTGQKGLTKTFLPFVLARFGLNRSFADF